MYKSIQGKIAQQYHFTGEECKVIAEKECKADSLRSVYAFLYTRVFYSKKKNGKIEIVRL